MALDKITLDRIKTLHPKVREEVLKMYTYANEVLLGKGVRLRFSHTFRTPEEQTELYAQGRTKKGAKVTNAKAWESPHNYGLAIDIVFLIDRDGDGKFESTSYDINADLDKDKIPDWIEIVNYFKSFGWVWGGNFKSFKDYPHFEKMFSYTPATLKAKIDKKNTIFENGIKYPLI